MHEYQILLRRKADVAKINSGFKARRVYGNVYGLRVFNGDETGFENKRFKNQATFLCEFNQAKLCEYLDTEFPGMRCDSLWFLDDFIFQSDCVNPYNP